MERNAIWWKHSPVSVLENGRVKLLWDFNIYTDKVIYTRRPDITVIDKMDNLVTFIDVAVPAGRRVTDKENEKIEKYQDLRVEDLHLLQCNPYIL